MSTALVEVRDLTKRYGARLALDSVSFTIPRGQVLGLLGPNGAGKTTAMRILTGYLSPSEGSVAVAGHDVRADSLVARSRIGYLPENNPLYGDLRVIEHLELGCRLRGIPRAHRAERITAVLAACGLADRRRDIVGRLSRGLRQRLGLALAVLHEPDLLLLDEPTTGLDPVQARETRELIRSLGREHTVVLSSHVLPEVARTCQRVLILHSGRLLADDEPERLADRLGSGTAVDVEVTVRGDAARVRSALAEVADLEAVAVEEQPGGRVWALVRSPAEDPRELVAAAMVRAELGLLELKARPLSLEDVFVQLVREDGS